MFFGRFKVARIGPFNIFVDIGWFLAFLFFGYALASYASALLKTEIFSLPSLSFGIIGFLLLYLCVLIHELSHSVVANKTGAPVKEITFFLLGAVAHITKYPDKAGQEFKIAVVGPLSNFVIAGLIWAFAYAMFVVGLNPGLYSSALADLMFSANIVLGVFNLLPAFPMDGGRILRSVLWHLMKDQIKATKAAVVISKIIAALMAAVGIWFGQIVLLILAVFLFFAAPAELKYLHGRKKLSTIAAQEIMHPVIPPVALQNFDIDEKFAICSADSALDEVLTIMNDKQVKKVCVARKEYVIGYITAADIENLLKN